MYVSVAELDKRISPNDHMLTANEEAYFRTSLSATNAILAMTSLSGLDRNKVRRALDFGCGYGRVLRGFAPAFPQASVTACDLMANAVSYCVETFGAVPLQGHENLGDIAPTAPFDVIWAGSVLTHLRPLHWHETLEFFASRLADDGVMVFSTHGRTAFWVFQQTLAKRVNQMSPEAFEQAKVDYKRNGYAFVVYSAKHGRSLDRIGITVTEGKYGLSFTSPAWIAKYMEGFPALFITGLCEGGWGNNHDIVAIKKPKLRRDVL